MTANTGLACIVGAGLLATSAVAQVAEPDIEKSIKSAVSSNLAEDKKPSQSVEACWRAWKQDQQLAEGKNERDGHLILLSHQQQAVNADAGARNWLSARNTAFKQAELQARADLATTISSMIKSDRSSAVKTLGGDEAAPSLEPAVNELSIVEKADVLVGKALDNEISKYDPNWNSNASETEKQKAVIALQARLQENVADRSQLYTSGAFTIAQCEGMSEEDNGKYSILVGMVWSPKLAKAAESVWNKDYILPPEASDISLSDQIKAFEKADPDWLAYSLGARVFTDEKGERVIVGFGVAPQSSLMSADRSRAQLEALAAIQRFVAEKVVAKRQIGGAFEQRDFSDGTTRVFDNNAFTAQIDAASPELRLQGTSEVTSWRGEHPWSHAKMQVVAIAWTKSWATDSLKTEGMMAAIEQRMSRQGAVPSKAPEKNRSFKTMGSAAPTHSGASSKVHGF